MSDNKRISKDKKAGDRRSAAPALLGLALIGALGVGGYVFFLAPSEEGAGFDFSALPTQEWVAALPLKDLAAMLPFLGPQDNDETIAILQDNAALVKRAVDAHVKETGKAPATGAAIEKQLKKLGKSLTHPYKPGEPVAIVVGDAPSGPAAIAFDLKKKGYDIRVGAIDGAALAIEDQDFVLSGRLKGAPQRAPRPRVAGAPDRPAVAARPKAPAARPAEDAVAVTPRAAKPPLPRPRRLPTPPPVAAAPTPAPYFPHQNAVEIRRNQNFDHWRIRGMALVYEQRTAESLVAFRKALAMKPNDPAVNQWVEVIQGVINRHTAAERAKYEEARAAHMAELAQAMEKVRAEQARMAAQAAAARPAATPDAPAGVNDAEALRLYNELKKEKAPLLAPPNLDE